MRKGEIQKRAMQTDEPVYLTKEGIEKIKRQIERIKRELPAAIEELARTREMGDLSENAAYHEAKRIVRSMQSRQFQLEERLKQVIEIEKGPSDSVQLGTTVRVETGGKELTYELVGPLETDPMRGRISHVSPIGKALTNKKVGEIAVFESPSGPKEYKILEIS